jgi:alanyl aminopeptidase
MGPEEFRKGVQSYLKQYSFRATTATDFLDALSSSSKRDVTKPFSTFLNQAGVPIVSVKVECAQGKPSLTVEQKRFLPLGSKGSAEQKWEIPLCIRYGTGTAGQEKCTLVTDASQTIALNDAKACPAWVQANGQAMGYYLVDYQGGLLGALTAGSPPAEVDQRLTAPERVDLMGNAQALSGGGKLPESDALALVETFHNDPERDVVQSALTLAMAPRAELVPDNLLPNYQRFLQKNFGTLAHQLGWAPKAGESADTTLLRAQVVRPVATWGGDEALASEGKALAAQWFMDRAAVDPNMLSSVLDTAAFYGDKALFDRFLSEYKSAKDRQIRQTLLGAMQSFRDPAAIEAGKQSLLNGDVPFMEGARLLFSGQETTATLKAPLDFLKAHWDEMVAKMPAGGGLDVGAQLPYVGASYCDASSRDELKAFFAPRVDKFVGAPRTLDQVIEGIDLCIARKAAEEPSVAAFLAKY